jgi:aspartyl-tRNA(Asn)/glutamyl-tRNA(Gln) amidotransferase subunit B
VKSRVIELPLARKQRFVTAYGIPAGDAEVFKNDVALGGYFERIARSAKNPKAIANWVINNLRAKLAEANEAEKAQQAAQGVDPAEMNLITVDKLKFATSAIAELIELVDAGKINTKTAQEVFAEMFASGESPAKIVERKGLAQVSDTGAIEQFCDEVIAANPGPAADFRAGKAAALNFLKGQVMKLSKGKANPGLVGEILERKLQG